MKITCSIPTRRPINLSGCVHAFSMLESYKHEVTYVACVDEDDHETIATAFDMKGYRRLAVLLTPRLPALGMYHNLAAERFPADVYCVVGDDVICASWQWDDAISNQVEKNPNGLWFFKTDERREAIYPIYTEGWRRASGGIFTDLFPFWYDDVWLREVASAVMGHDVPRLDGARLLDTPGPTTRMRDILFWDDFYQATRMARVHKAIEIAQTLGVDRTDEQIAAVVLNFGPNHDFRARCDEHQRIVGDNTEPTPEYLKAKRRAEEVMERLRESGVIKQEKANAVA